MVIMSNNCNLMPNNTSYLLRKMLLWVAKSYAQNINSRFAQAHIMMPQIQVHLSKRQNFDQQMNAKIASMELKPGRQGNSTKGKCWNSKHLSPVSHGTYFKHVIHWNVCTRLYQQSLECSGKHIFKCKNR